MKTQTWAYLRGFLWPYISAPHFSAETPASLEPGDKQAAPMELKNRWADALLQIGRPYGPAEPL